MSEEIREQKPEIKQPSSDSSSEVRREKEFSNTDQSSNEPQVEKSNPRQRRAEVQNPLMHESY